MAGQARRGMILALAAGLCCAGCGYRAGFRMPEGYGTIHVKVFENKTLYRGLDFELTELVKAEIMARTDMVVTRSDAADITLACALTDVTKSVRREDENDLPQEVNLRVAISASATNRAGEDVFTQKSLNKSVSYSVALGETESAARSRALRDVAEELVYRMIEQWAWKKGP